MWLISNLGFFSIVEKPQDRGAGVLTVRARVRADLESLRDRYLPSLKEIEADSDTDYQFCARVSRESLAIAIAKMANDIDYSNFKNAVAERQGKNRARVYGEAWQSLSKLPQSTDSTFRVSMPSRRPHTCVGVLIDDEGRVLLREPTRPRNGPAWTFPSGALGPDESETDAVIRIARETTGYPVKILSRLAIEHSRSAVAACYRLGPTGRPIPFQLDQTQSIRWLEPDEARKMIRSTKNTESRDLDLAILQAACPESDD